MLGFFCYTHYQVCIILNNMQHIRQELSQFEEKLELQSFCDWLEAEEKLGGPFKELVKNVLESADEDIFNKMNQIMLEITGKVQLNGLMFEYHGINIEFVCIQLSPDIQAFVHNVITKDGMMNDEEVCAVCPTLNEF